MQKTSIAPFKVIGLSVRTTNQDGKSAQDIGQLWEQFMSENIAGKIPDRLDDEVLAIYTNYESDHTAPYDTILGCRVRSLDSIPSGLVGQSFEGGTYVKFVAKGDLNEGAVYAAWSEIWASNLDRAFTADFEVYGEKAQNPKRAEVDIMIAMS